MINHLAFFLPDLRGGGAERVVVTLANHLAVKMRVDLVVCKAFGPLLDECSPEVKIVNFNVSNAYLGLIPLCRYFRLSLPDVLLSTLDLTSAIALTAKELTCSKTRIIIRLANTVSIQQRHPIKKTLERWIMRNLYPRANGLIAVSEGVAKDFSKYSSIPQDRISVIYNPVINQIMLEMSEESVSHPWFIDHELPIVLAVGRLTSQKNYPLMVQSFAALQKEIPSRLIILGEGDQREDLEHLILEFGISDSVDMPGFHLNPFSYMKRADCFVLSSDYEGLPNALIQAMACGCPVISTDCPSGPGEILDGGRFGHLVPVGNIEALTNAMKDTLQGNHRLPPRTWLSKYEVNYVATQYLAQFESAL